MLSSDLRLCGCAYRKDLQNDDACQETDRNRGGKAFDVYLTKIAEKLSFLLRLDPIKRTRLELTLNIAGIPLSPESYTMKAFLTAAATALCGLPFFFFMPLMGILVFGLAIVMWFATYYKAPDLVKNGKTD